MQGRTLESHLEGLLKFGTILCSVIIAVGIMQNGFAANPPAVDLVRVGIVGFIALPVVRVITMLRHYRRSYDIPMMIVVGIVLTLVIVGLMVGILW